MFIANHVITQHGGSIQVTSTPGEGSRFLIHLPRHRPEKNSVSKLAEVPSTPQNTEPAELQPNPGHDS